MIDGEIFGFVKSYVDSHGGGDPGTSNYNDLDNRPQINNITLAGNKSASDLGLAAECEVSGTMLLI